MQDEWSLVPTFLSEGEVERENFLNISLGCKGVVGDAWLQKQKTHAQVAKKGDVYFDGFQIDPWYWDLQLNTVKRTEKKEGVQEFSDWSKNLRLGIFQPCLVQVFAWCNCFTKIPTSSASDVYSFSGFLKHSFLFDKFGWVNLKFKFKFNLFYSISNSIQIRIYIFKFGRFGLVGSISWVCLFVWFGC